MSRNAASRDAVSAAAIPAATHVNASADRIRIAIVIPESSRRTMALRLGPDLPLVQPCHRRERPYPRTYPGEHNVECVFGVTDDREGREHIPDRAPVRRPVAPPATDRSIE